jgi:predicted  nucleic acid-binding Zn-ribbon protein
VAKAAPAEQLKLLELQGLDAKLKSLSNRRRSLESDSRITDLEAALGVANGELGAAKVAVHDAELELKRSEADVEQVASRIERDEARLNSGTGLSKDLVALQRDLVSLNKRRSDLEDVELEVLERLDSLRLRQATQQQIVDDIQGSFGVIRAELDEQLAEIAAEATVVRGKRAEFAADLDPGMLAIYEKTLAKRGVGAARLFHGTSEGSGMHLSPGDLAEIKAAAEDDIVFCPDSGCILVRSAEWSGPNHPTD